MASWVMIITALLFSLATLRPALMRSAAWRATATPLASIIGSGFLVAGPILSDTTGRLAMPAMMGLCAVAWLFGSAIRHNIVHVEPLLATRPTGWLRVSERASDLALAFAYFISVAYYLNLFAAFGLRIMGMTDQFAIRLLSTGVTATLGIIGLLRGLHWLERIEVPAVGVKLALIAGLEMALIWATSAAVMDGGFRLPVESHPTGFAELRILLGLVILVQGFETSRYLGQAYGRRLRIRTMRHAQLLATLIYGVFIGLATPYFTDGLPTQGGETAVIDMLRPLGWAVAPLLIVTALASQLSAAVADMNGAGGLIGSGVGQRIDDKWGYAVTALIAVAFTWAANLYEIIAYASKAFVLYYGLQCAIAAILAARRRRPHRGRALVYALGIVLALAVLALGAPAEAG